MKIFNLDKKIGADYQRILAGKPKRAEKNNLFSVDYASFSADKTLTTAHYSANPRSFEDDFLPEVPQNLRNNAGTIAILNIKGALDYSESIFHYYFGGTSYEQLNRVFDSVMADSEISTVILKIQSPGGSAIGASELSQKIFNARSQKRIVTFADPYMFSAGYQIGTAASEIYTIKSGMVGSVGTYAAHYDYSEKLKNDGIKVTFISAGDKKVDGNSAEPLSESAKNDLQAEVDELYSMFIDDLARNRGASRQSVIENYGQGATVLAKAALEMGMLDGILNFEELLKKEAQALQENKSKVKNKIAFENAKIFLELENLE